MATADTRDDSQDFIIRKRARSANLSQLTKLYNELEKGMSSYDNKDNVVSLYNKIKERFDQFKSAHLQCLDICADTDTANTLIDHFGSCQKNLVEFEDRYAQWLTGYERPKPEDDSGSHVSRTMSCASVSSSSQVNLQNAKARRLIAELKLEKLSKRQELERAQRELEYVQSELTLKQQLFEQQCEVEEAALEESVWQQATKEDTITTNKSTIVHVPLQSSTRDTVNYDVGDKNSAVRETVCLPEASILTEVKVRPGLSKTNEQSKNSKRSETSDVTSRDEAFQHLALRFRKVLIFLNRNC